MTYNEKEFLFMDNSFALMANMWCHPVFYDVFNDIFYNGDSGYEEGERMDVLELTIPEENYLRRCFEAYEKVRFKIWDEYKAFVASHPNGIYSIHKSDAIKFVNDIMGYDYVGDMPKNFRL